MLTRTAGGLGMGDGGGGGGRPKGVLLEVPMSCCDSWLSRATVCSSGTGEELL